MSVWFDVPGLFFYFACFSLIFLIFCFVLFFVVNCSDLNSVGCGFLIFFIFNAKYRWLANEKNTETDSVYLHYFK